MKFPKKIYVTIEESGGGDPFLEIATNIKYIDEYVDQVAIYELKEVKTLKVTRELK